LKNYYVPRVEVTNDKETTSAWQIGGSNRKSDAIKEAKHLNKEIAEGKWDKYLTEQEKAKGYHLNACVEVQNDDGDLLKFFIKDI